MEKPATTKPDVWRTSLIAAPIVVVGALLKFWYLYLDDLARDRRVFLEIGPELLVDRRLNDAFDFAVPEFRFGLSFELWFSNFYRYNTCQTFAKVISIDIKFFPCFFEICFNITGDLISFQFMSCF